MRRTRNLVVDLARGFGLLALLLALLAGIGWFMWSDWVPQSTTDRLPGASRAEVRELLGEPASADDDPDGGGVWCYRPPGRLAEFQVWFGPGGRVREWHYDR